VSGSSEEPLWRAIAVFRFASLGYAMVLVGFVTTAGYARLDWAWVALAAMTVWTVVTTFAYAHRHGRTVRETEVLRMVATGLSCKQIATRLVLSHRTVQNHVQNTLGKLQLHNRVELVRYAIEHGLADEPEDRPST
jgi:DNA-binding CsgD family transcriptional regulator